jgi:vancomycin permeability regulator SanA
MNKTKKYIFFITAVGIANLFLLYYVKYVSNQLSIADFDISKTGNIINLVLTVLLSFGCILILASKVHINTGHLKFLSLISAIYLIPLLIIIFFNSLQLEFIQDYLFGYPFKKIIPIIFYVVNQILFLFVLFMVWYIYFGHNTMSYFYSLLSVVGTIIFFLIVSLTYTSFVEEHDHQNDNEKFEYGIILGAAVWSGNRPSPIFTGRIDKGAKLFADKVIEKIQLTGGNAPGEVSEAKAAFTYLTEKYNITSNNILIEEVTSTTNEQIRFIKNKVANGKDEIDFLFISDEFHLQRISEMADFYNLNAKVVSSEYKLNFQKSLYYRFRDSIGLILFWFFAI